MLGRVTRAIYLVFIVVITIMLSGIAYNYSVFYENFIKAPIYEKLLVSAIIIYLICAVLRLFFLIIKTPEKVDDLFN